MKTHFGHGWNFEQTPSGNGAANASSANGAAKPSGLRRARARKSCSGEAVVELQAAGNTEEVEATLVDVSDFGVGFETNQPLEVGVSVTIISLFFDSGAEVGRREGKIVHCTLRSANVYRSGVSFDQPEAEGDQNSLDEQTGRAARGLFVDYYEALQISANADVEMIHRAHTVLSERFQGALEGSRNEACLRLVDEAHRVLHDPVLRAAYDVKHRRQAHQWQAFGKTSEQGSGDDERAIRRAILSLLYAARRKQGGPHGLTPKELEDLLLCPREHLEFSLWYLRGKGYAVVASNERYGITPGGVDAVEGNEERPATTLAQLQAPLPT